MGPAGQLLSWWSRAGTAIAIHSCQRCKGLQTFPGSPGLTCWAVVVPRGHHSSWEECGGKERLVVWSCSLRSERRKKDAKEKQRNTGESRGLWREGRIWSCLERGLEKLERSWAGGRLRDGGLGLLGPHGCCTCEVDEVGEMHHLHDPRLHFQVEEGSGGHLVSLAQVPVPGISVNDGPC